MTVRRPTFRPSLAQVKRANQRAMDLYASCSDRPRFDVGARPARQPAQSPRPKPGRQLASEAEVQTAVLAYLCTVPDLVRIERHNRGAATDEHGRPIQFNKVIKGGDITIVDVVGMFRDGRHLAIELKREGWRMAGPDAMHDTAVRERKQAAYIAQTVECGGVGGFVRSVDEARAVVEGSHV